jgi:hypothetical protein
MAHLAYLDQHCPGWDESPAERHMNNAKQVAEFYQRNLRFPSPDEGTLGKWLETQRKKRRLFVERRQAREEAARQQNPVQDQAPVPDSAAA